jgi:hypothetical protein
MSQKSILLYSLYAIRKLGRVLKIIKRPLPIDNSKVQYFNQEANDLVYETLVTGKPCMISKFGTTELSSIVSHILCHENLSLHLVKDFFHKDISLNVKSCNENLKRYSGFFPNTPENCEKFVQLNLSILGEIDILGSYISQETYINSYLNKHCKKINLEGYYAPFLWTNPWTRVLENKKVLVIHPFVESIKHQYETNRDKLFKDPMVLPRFKELRLIKAVQSLGGNNAEFSDWFEALESMKEQIRNTDFDIALIGCGAYGMPLAAYVKQLGKQAVHLAGWTQMLFGIYGKRWVEDQQEFSKFINDYWIRPTKNETPISAKQVEGGCYW